MVSVAEVISVFYFLVYFQVCLSMQSVVGVVEVSVVIAVRVIVVAEAITWIVIDVAVALAKTDVEPDVLGYDFLMTHSVDMAVAEELFADCMMGYHIVMTHCLDIVGQY